MSTWLIFYQLARIMLMKLAVLIYALILSFNSSAQTQTEQKAEQTTLANESDTPIDWGDWSSQAAPPNAYGVGIKGKIEAQISQLDQSTLLENANGVAVTKKASREKSRKSDTTQNLKKMMAELEAMETKVRQEIEDESEF